MLHPITNNRRNLMLYGVFWMLIALIHGTFFYTFYQASVYLTIIDSFIFNLLFAVVGLGLWYAVKYSQMETTNVGNLFTTHVTAAAVTLVFVLSMGYYSLKPLTFLHENYTEFFRATLIWRILTGAIEYILIVLVYYLIMYYLNFIDKINSETELKSSLKVAELNLIKNRFNPHFLFNSLNSISALTVSQPQQAREMVLKLSDFLRFSISEKPDALRLFSEETENISKYLDIEKIRFGDRLQIKKDISKKCAKAHIPSLILQPIVENAVKHGVSESTDQVAIRILADCFHGYLKVQIENDVDEKIHKKKPGNGIGLQNIAQRLKLIYGREDLLSVGREHGKFMVTITFPQNGTYDTDHSD